MSAADGRPLAVYTDVVDTDPSVGVDILEAAGIATKVIGSADADDIIAHGEGADALLPGYSHIGARVLDALPDVKVVAAQSVGTDMVDLDACRDRNICVTNVAGVATQEVAEHALALSLALSRGVVQLDRSVQDGTWDGTQTRLRRLSDLTVGVIGLGRIGMSYATMMGSLARHVVGYDPSGQYGSVTARSLDDVFAEADLLSLHLPSTPETDGVVDARRLALMKSGSLLVNVSRGSLIDEEALLAALNGGQLAGAALDVLAHEPPDSGHRLIGHPRTIVTPHAAYLSESTIDAYVRVQAENVAAFLTGGTPSHIVWSPTITDPDG